MDIHVGHLLLRLFLPACRGGLQVLKFKKDWLFNGCLDPDPVCHSQRVTKPFPEILASENEMNEGEMHQRVIPFTHPCHLQGARGSLGLGAEVCTHLGLLFVPAA